MAILYLVFSYLTFTLHILSLLFYSVIDYVLHLVMYSIYDTVLRVILAAESEFDIEKT